MIRVTLKPEEKLDEPCVATEFRCTVDFAQLPNSPEPAERQRSVLQMIEHCSVVEDVFSIEGRGCVIVPGIPSNAADSHVKIGDHVYILACQNECIDTVIRGIEMVYPPVNGFPVLLPRSIEKDDIPIGSVINIIEQSPKDYSKGRSVLNDGDAVHVRTNKRNKTFYDGVIDRKVWHYKYQLWYYYIRDNTGRRISKRYTAADLIRTANGTEIG